MYKVIIWGSGSCYNRLYNSIKLQELNGSIKVLAITSNDMDIKSTLDGYPFLSKEKASMLDYDYCLVTIEDMSKILDEATLLGIPKSKLIPIRVFSIPHFDFNKYISIKESNVSIISSNCWAGLCYHYLGFEFLSPTINMFFNRNDFNKFVQNLEYYLSLPVEFVEMYYETNLRHYYPIGIIGDIKLNFNHYTNFDYAQECWERRKNRINLDNLLIISSTISVDDAIEFDKLPYKNKLIFVPKDFNTKSSFHINYEDHHDGVTIGMVANGTANGTKSLIDILAFLNHEPNFLRTI